MTELLKKYKPLVPEHVDFVKTSDTKTFRLDATKAKAIANDPDNGGSIQKVRVWKLFHNCQQIADLFL